MQFNGIDRTLILPYSNVDVFIHSTHTHTHSKWIYFFSYVSSNIWIKRKKYHFHITWINNFIWFLPVFVSHWAILHSKYWLSFNSKKGNINYIEVAGWSVSFFLCSFSYSSWMYECVCVHHTESNKIYTTRTTANKKRKKTPTDERKTKDELHEKHTNETIRFIEVKVSMCAKWTQRSKWKWKTLFDKFFVASRWSLL